MLNLKQTHFEFIVTFIHLRLIALFVVYMICIRDYLSGSLKFEFVTDHEFYLKHGILQTEPFTSTVTTFNVIIILLHYYSFRSSRLSRTLKTEGV